MKRSLIFIFSSLFFLATYSYCLAAPVVGYWTDNQNVVIGGTWIETFDGGDIWKAGNIMDVVSTDNWQWEVQDLVLDSDPTLHNTWSDGNVYQEDYDVDYLGGTLTLKANLDSPEPWFGIGDTSYTATVNMNARYEFEYYNGAYEGFGTGSWIIGTIDDFPDFTVGLLYDHKNQYGWDWYQLEDGYHQGELSGTHLYIIETPNPIPIPGAVWLLGSGLIGLVGLRKKFHK